MIFKLCDKTDCKHYGLLAGWNLFWPRLARCLLCAHARRGDHYETRPQKCPLCGKGVLNLETRDEEFEYKKVKFTVKAYESMKCGYCGEGIVDHRLAKRNEEKIKKHHERIDRQGEIQI